MLITACSSPNSDPEPVESSYEVVFANPIVNNNGERVNPQNIVQSDAGGYLVCGIDLESPRKAWAAYIDQDGTESWNRSYSEARDFVAGIQLHDGGYALGADSPAADEIFLIKLTSQGDFSWLVTYDFPYADNLHSISEAPDSSIFATMNSYEVHTNSLLTRVSKDGTLLWQIEITDSIPRAITTYLDVLPNNQVLLIGYTQKDDSRTNWIRLYDFEGNLVENRVLSPDVYLLIPQLFTKTIIRNEETKFTSLFWRTISRFDVNGIMEFTRELEPGFNFDRVAMRHINTTSAGDIILSGAQGREIRTTLPDGTISITTDYYPSVFLVNTSGHLLWRAQISESTQKGNIHASIVDTNGDFVSVGYHVIDEISYGQITKIRRE